jgi:hypothetical protein
MAVPRLPERGHGGAGFNGEGGRRLRAVEWSVGRWPSAVKVEGCWRPRIGPGALGRCRVRTNDGGGDSVQWWAAEVGTSGQGRVSAMTNAVEAIQ